MWRCKSNGDWSPCHGGSDPGKAGEGYCQPHHFGPRCELCVSNNPFGRYFDKLKASCRDCGDSTALAGAVIASFVALWVAVLGLRDIKTRNACAKKCQAPLRWYAKGRRLWEKAGMRCKVKAIVGLYQCVAAVPSVFDVLPPEGLEDYGELSVTRPTKQKRRLHIFTIPCAAL
eukprot:174337-Prymnesium_polylepis.2